MTAFEKQCDPLTYYTLHAPISLFSQNVCLLWQTSVFVGLKHSWRKAPYLLISIHAAFFILLEKELPEPDRQNNNNYYATNGRGSVTNVFHFKEKGSNKFPQPFSHDEKAVAVGVRGQSSVTFGCSHGGGWSLTHSPKCHGHRQHKWQGEADSTLAQPSPTPIYSLSLLENSITLRYSVFPFSCDKRKAN